MYAVTVCDHMMVAHSLPDPFFGPAQALHGATYVVEVCLRAERLDEHQVVVDIGAATEHVAAVVGELSYRNLDEHPAFAGALTTTEVLARYVAERMAEALRAMSPPPELHSIEVILTEHPRASAGYTLVLPT
ncbi:MAG TPA: 6-carboxytetrahydropterin synthase [Ornithinimicrobium sp.]|uniref:6-pyruvoyl trahydropterin synthase family protein n=1 Tax=Ornithinimicrobium sp. TaxID=1977084 RepID=UPI002B49550B|nr:6-carboxytetrahydropterin synthase [Ornithinimicrobium sp.]HKJ11999.1 6-carboxytetrahydropterin synthase [Ornithinimicrobium sp.]